MTKEEITKIKEHIEIHARQESRAVYITKIMWKAVAELEHIAELEQKLEQTEKDLADYQFNYPKIKELEQTNNNLLDVINNQDVKIADLEKKNEELTERLEDLQEQNSEMFNTIALQEQQIEKIKRHCNCKHRDSEGYCEVKRTYLIDLSYDGCDKWELED